MLDYSENQIRDIVVSILNINRLSIYPIGHHELERHLVYLVVTEQGEKLIFKLFYVSDRRNREIAALGLLEHTDVKCPRALQYGILEDGTEWLITEWLEGEPFDKVRHEIPIEGQLKIFEAMGEQLGIMHSHRIFDFFGNWDEEGHEIESAQDYHKNFVKTTEEMIELLLKQNLPEKELLHRGIEKLRENYGMIKDIKESRLRHNDFNGRNVLVKKENAEWVLSGVIDFEQSKPGNVEIDIAGLYAKYFIFDSALEEAFFKGYLPYMSVSKNFHKRLNFYLLLEGLGICSWALEQAPDYYQEGIQLVKMFVDKPE